METLKNEETKRYGYSFVCDVIKCSLSNKSTEIEDKAGEVILINKSKTYFWDSRCKVLMPCTPCLVF